MNMDSEALYARNLQILTLESQWRFGGERLLGPRESSCSPFFLGGGVIIYKGTLLLGLVLGLGFIATWVRHLSAPNP